MKILGYFRRNAARPLQTVTPDTGLDCRASQRQYLGDADHLACNKYRPISQTPSKRVGLLGVYKVTVLTGSLLAMSVL